jgi:hypothetical protein
LILIYLYSYIELVEVVDNPARYCGNSNTQFKIKLNII